jgi:hypothetical protein
MPTTPYSGYEIQLTQIGGWPEGPAALAAGGTFIVCTANTPDKATIVNADDFTALANPITATRGKLRFATLASVLTVDIYGFTADGCFVFAKGVRPGGTSEIFYDAGRSHQVAMVPFHWSDYTIAAEADTGLDLPAGSLVLPTVAVRVTTADATETIDVGLLSSESGGDADGFLVAASVGTVDVTVPGLLVGTDTLGALLKEDTNGSSVLVPRPYPVAAARSIVILLSTGSDTAAGFILIPYLRTLV